ncbi:MAG: CHASE2 domain-containing protein [Rhodomicrobium sp.]|nr:CHASE2 domain-containing protein [Rhodomicrobium sp.]
MSDSISREGSRASPAPGIKIVIAAILAVLTSIALVALSRGGLLPEAQDRALYDWRSFYLTSPADAQRDDIALVLIDEDSLAGYHCLSPVDRGLIAELVRTIDGAGAKVIGLDFIFDRTAGDEVDHALISAIRDAKNARIVQGALISAAMRPLESKFQEDLLVKTGAPAGHLYFGSEKNRFTLGDQAVRYRMPEGFGTPPRPSFAWALAAAAEKAPDETPASSLITWQRPPVGSADLFTTLVVRPHRDAQGNRIREPLSTHGLATLAGKIVLIGGAFTDRDRHLTPWTVASGDRVPGVEVHAQILAHLIDKRWTYEPDIWWEIPLLIFVFAVGFYAAQRWRLSGSGVLTSIAAFIILILAGIALYASLRVMLPSATIVIAWSAGLFFGSVADYALLSLRRRAA